ncbi:MAG: farnesyl diphosphate synthase [Planctomycetota bacterium]|nr:farnesyl diphosphate synthase [Planctomycetota bacterium]
MAVSPPMAFTEQAQLLRDQVDLALQRELNFSTDCPSLLSEAIRYAGMGPGKRLRPILVLLAAEACGARDREDAMATAVAVECVHAYSLVHDDLPAMDDDDLRRGRPTCHRAFSEPTAILAGDALLTRAFEILATSIQPPETATRCIRLLAQAAGAEGMVGGQMQDLLASASPTDGAGGVKTVIDETSAAEKERKLEAMHRKKTGALFVASLQLGGMVAGSTESDQAALRDFGEKIGLAFQIVDDLLDVAGKEEQIGKRVGKDDALGKLTFPGLLGITESKERAQVLVCEACVAIEHFGQRAAALRDLATYILERDS